MKLYQATVGLGEEVSYENLEEVVYDLLKNLDYVEYEVVPTEPGRHLIVNITVRDKDVADEIYTRAIDKWEV